MPVVKQSLQITFLVGHKTVINIELSTHRKIRLVIITSSSGHNQEGFYCHASKEKCLWPTIRLWFVHISTLLFKYHHILFCKLDYCSPFWQYWWKFPVFSRQWHPKPSLKGVIILANLEKKEATRGLSGGAHLELSIIFHFPLVTP